MTLEEQALKLYPPLSCYEKEPIEYNRRQAACREAWLRAKREDAAVIERLRAALHNAKDALSAQVQTEVTSNALAIIDGVLTSPDYVP